MSNFDIKRTSRKCSVSERAFEAGEEFYSALVEVDGELVRQDFAHDSWDGEPNDSVGWWTSRMPDLEQGKVYWAPNSVLFAYFEHTYERGDAQADIAYVLAILMVQKRILQMIETDESTTPPTLVVHNRKSKTDYRIPQIDLPPDRLQQIQDELAENLFTSSAPGGEAEI